MFTFPDNDWQPFYYRLMSQTPYMQCKTGPFVPIQKCVGFEESLPWHKGKGNFVFGESEIGQGPFFSEAA